MGARKLTRGFGRNHLMTSEAGTDDVKRRRKEELQGGKVRRMLLREE